MKSLFTYTALIALAAGACNKDVKVKTESDINEINAQCSKFEGNIVIDNVQGLSAVNLNSVKEVDGNIVIQNMKALKTVSLGQLGKADALKILNNTNLYQVDVPELSEVDDFQVITNPNLKILNYKNLTSVENFQIINTIVSKIEPLNVKEVKNIEVISNGQLQELDFGKVQEAKGYINIANNGRDTNVSFASLEQVSGNFSVGNSGSLDIGKLTTVSDDFSLYENSFTNITASEFESTKKSITINGNTDLKSIEFPKLKSIGSSLNIGDNPELNSIGSRAFPKLTEIDGGVVINGTFNNITFPAIKDISGAVKIDGEGKMDCKDFESEYKKVSKKIKCNLVKIEDDDESSSDGKSSKSNSSNSEEDDSAAVVAFKPSTIATIVGAAAVAVAGFM